MTPQKHSISFRVYYEDTDAGGIVFYANYLKYAERARTEWLRELNIHQSDLLEQNLGFVVRKVEMNNLASAKLDDLVTIESKIVKLKKASLVFDQAIYNQENTLLCTVSVVVAAVNLSQMKPCAIPTQVLGALQRAC